LYINNVTDNSDSQSKEPDWMRDFEGRQVAKEMAIKLKASHLQSCQCLYTSLQEAAERKLRRQERVKKLKEQYGPLAAKHWMKKKVDIHIVFVNGVF